MLEDKSQVKDVSIIGLKSQRSMFGAAKVAGTSERTPREKRVAEKKLNNLGTNSPQVSGQILSPAGTKQDAKKHTRKQ